MSYIVSDKIPMCCGICPCFHAEHPMHCQAVKADKNKSVYAPYEGDRPDWCPLIEIPSHGTLVDVDAMLTDLTKYMRMLDPESKEYSKILWIETYLNLAKNEAIIEAEE